MEHNPPTKLKMILVYKGLTQKDLAKMTGLQLCIISNLTTGKRKNIQLVNAKKICKALNMSLDDVFGDYE